MKGSIVLLVTVICLFMASCNNEFAKTEYDSNQKIAQTEDRYAKEKSVFNSIKGGYTLTASKFDGRETLWTEVLDEAQDVSVEFSFNISNGHAKIVHIDNDGNVSDIIECSPEGSLDIAETKTVAMTSGINRLKIVGYNCEDVDLKILFDDPQ